MTNKQKLDELMQAALKIVQDMDWKTWHPQPGDAWIVERYFEDQPPLTDGILQWYLTDCAWIWQRPITPFEQERVKSTLLERWMKDSLDMEYTWVREILCFVWLPQQMYRATPGEREAMRAQLAAQIPDGAFPGIDTLVPFVAEAESALTPKISASTLRTPDETGVALDGLYLGTNRIFDLNIYGPPGSGTWVDKTELYAFFPDGQYLYFPSREEAGRHLQDPKGHKAYGGAYEISNGQLKLYDNSNGQTNTSPFGASADAREIKFYDKTFTWSADTTGLRV